MPPISLTTRTRSEAMFQTWHQSQRQTWRRHRCIRPEATLCRAFWTTSKSSTSKKTTTVVMLAPAFRTGPHGTPAARLLRARKSVSRIRRFARLGLLALSRTATGSLCMTVLLLFSLRQHIAFCGEKRSAHLNEDDQACFILDFGRIDACIIQAKKRASAPLAAHSYRKLG